MRGSRKFAALSRRLRLLSLIFVVSWHWNGPAFAAFQCLKRHKVPQIDRKQS
jgi:hypothetical protein